MEKIIKVVKEYLRERKIGVKEIDKSLKKIAKKAKKLLGKNTHVYVFGSYVEGNFHEFLSDVDVLIVSDKVTKFKNMFKRASIVSKLRKGIKAGYIFEIHLVTPKEFDYYKFFVKKMVRIG